jgi:hypothetical protein
LLQSESSLGSPFGIEETGRVRGKLVVIRSDSHIPETLMVATLLLKLPSTSWDIRSLVSYPSYMAFVCLFVLFSEAFDNGDDPAKAHKGQRMRSHSHAEALYLGATN